MTAKDRRWKFLHSGKEELLDGTVFSPGSLSWLDVQEMVWNHNEDCDAYEAEIDRLMPLARVAWVRLLRLGIVLKDITRLADTHDPGREQWLLDAICNKAWEGIREIMEEKHVRNT